MTNFVKCIRDRNGRMVPRWSWSEDNCPTQLRRNRLKGKPVMHKLADQVNECMLRCKLRFDSFSCVLEGDYHRLARAHQLHFAPLLKFHLGDAE